MRERPGMFPEAGALFYGGAGCAGRNDTNGWLRTKSLMPVSELRSPQPRIRAARRTRRGCWRRNSTTTATLSSSERKRCSGVYDSRPIWICTAGRARGCCESNPCSAPSPRGLPPPASEGRTPTSSQPSRGASRSSDPRASPAGRCGRGASPIPVDTAGEATETRPVQAVPAADELRAAVSPFDRLSA